LKYSRNTIETGALAKILRVKRSWIKLKYGRNTIEIGLKYNRNTIEIGLKYNRNGGGIKWDRVEVWFK
jgi:hypothetical protein